MEKPPMVGKNIQQLRSDQKLTLNVLSERSGVSKAMLSQIESDKVNPTIATIWKIAQGLGVEIHTLLAGAAEPKRKFKVHRYENITTLDTEEEGVHIHVLSPLSMVEDLEMYMMTFAPGTSLPSEAHFPKTEEFLTVIKGQVRVTAGENIADLRKGDFISYHCDINHTIENIGRSEAAVHLVVRYNQMIKKTP
ncbi:MAG: XRE family transcriptional regulator [Spirochaetia bacterium]|nr:XRE family transcriptional regulator [Spirochaetia bacterium]MCF7941719.1 XRE family transcriptional regulator [Spirochaetia bacterium]